MKKFTLLVLLIVFAFTLFGCAGGGSGTSGSNAGSSNNSGALSIKVNWPSGSKTSVLASAYSIKLNVCTRSTATDGTTIYRREINAIAIKHSTANATENTTINGIPIGPRTVIVQAYDNTGTEIGYGTTSVTIASGDNSGVTITLTLGTFAYTIMGMADVTVPTESGGGGGGGSSTTYSYFFVNNYGNPNTATNGSISVLKESKTTGSSTTYSTELAGTISCNNMLRPCKGVFNTAGTYYYVTNADSGNPAVYQITPNTSSWSSSTVTSLYSFPIGSLPQEILYINGYLYVGVRPVGGPYYIDLYKINATTGTATSVRVATDEGDPGLAIVGLCTVPGTNNFILNYQSMGVIIPRFCDDNLILGDPGEWSGPAASSVGLTFIFAVPVMTDAATLYTPTQGRADGSLGAVFKYTLANARLSWDSEYAKSELNFRKFLYYNGTGYALSAVSGGISYIYYSAPPNFDGQRMNTGAYSTSDLADMAFNADKTRIYATDFGMTLGGGSKVFIKTIASPDTFLDPVTVGVSPIGITLKP